MCCHADQDKRRDPRLVACLRAEEPDTASLHVSMAKGHYVANDDREPKCGPREDGIRHSKLGHIVSANAQVKERIQHEEGVHSHV